MSAMTEWKRRAALIAGGTRGLGRSIAEYLLGRGWDVAVCARQRPAAEIRAGNAQAWAVTADIGHAASVAALLRGVDRAFGRLDLLVNHAGNARPMDSAAFTPSSVASGDRCFPHATVNLCRAAFPELRRSGGSVVNILRPPVVNRSPVDDVAGLATEWRGAVRVNTIIVSPVDGEVAGNDDPVGAALPVAGPVQEDHVGAVVEWLASAEASHVTAARIALRHEGEAMAPANPDQYRWTWA
jgi:NAD(P)-dependent dehydrogenase (short-subunit alcohol dehydrogenase family)